jgi:large subunit ribosomal protein L24
MKLKIKKGSTVQVISGAEKGKKGTVLAVNSKKLQIKVEGIKVMTHFDKKDGLKTLESFFDYSNVKLLEAAAAPKAKKVAKTTKKSSHA